MARFTQYRDGDEYVRIDWQKGVERRKGEPWVGVSLADARLAVDAPESVREGLSNPLIW